MYTNMVDVPTYADTYAETYGDTILAGARVGSNGASLISFRRPPGCYRSNATSDFALMMVQNGGFGAELDLGMGRFVISVAPGQLFLSPPFLPTENAFHGKASGIVVALEHARVSEMLFAALARHGSTRSARARRGLADWQLRRVVEKLESMQDVSLAELAASANLSPFYFARAFKQTTGVPPHHFQQRVRIERAKDLLTTTALSITEIAFRVGYGSSQTLARVFRKSVGATPRRIPARRACVSRCHRRAFGRLDLYSKSSAVGARAATQAARRQLKLICQCR